MKKGTLHLIPSLLAENTGFKMPAYLVDVAGAIKIFYVEELRSARRFLKILNKETVIDDLKFYLLNEHHHEDLGRAKELLDQGYDIGYISEAGCPAVADPGQDLVRIAHETGAKVVPHIGPNSIIMALMASGFNGQRFHFHGYLPNKQPMLSQKIKEIEKNSREQNATQLFIETPYRNDQLIAELLRNCGDETWLCVAAGLTAVNELICSKKIKAWKKEVPSFHKIPAVFLIYCN